MPNVQAGFLRAAFPDYAPEEGTSLDDCVQDLKNICYPGILNWGSPRFFAYFPCRNSTTAFLSELFSTAYHTPGFMYAMSPSHTELENVVVDWTVKALGLPNYFLLENEGGSVLSSAIT